MSLPLSGFAVHCEKKVLELFKTDYLSKKGGTSPVVQWSGPRASTAGGTGFIPGQGTKVL